MASVVKQFGRKPARLQKPKRDVPAANPLDRARADEVDWQAVNALFSAARRFMNPSYVYVIGEQDGECLVKIGVSRNPIKRLRDMRVGNPHSLKVEQALIGTRSTERLIHEIWGEWAIRPGAEWFYGDVRRELLPVFATAADQHVELIMGRSGQVSERQFQRVVREAHGFHGIVEHRQAPVRLLGSAGAAGALRDPESPAKFEFAPRGA